MLDMKSFVVVATKGRAAQLLTLLDFLQRQTALAELVVIVGAEEADIAGVASHPLMKHGQAGAVVSPCPGSSFQRNYGLELLEQRGLLANSNFFCAFFDDDFRMADDWLSRAGERFAAGGIVGLTGMILGDGVRDGGYSEDYALALLSGDAPREEHWATGFRERDTGSVYGCNMAFSDTVIRNVRFDENLPLYAWQEDHDYTAQARRFGRVIYWPNCRGVHLGAQNGGRARGLPFGYSQIANPIYLMRKGTMEPNWTLKFVTRALASNILHSLGQNRQVDYRGRLRGNLTAIADLLSRRLSPHKILSLYPPCPTADAGAFAPSATKTAAD
ncbi:MAG: hypothetical protein JOY87_12470 [Candidatus Eremiobacteraeota bacterium]|nr:hypothetical protein [Candidatus Eremiobacteraeota bacterium]